MTDTPILQSSIRTARLFSFEGLRRPKFLIGGLVMVGTCAVLGVAISSHPNVAPVASNDGARTSIGALATHAAQVADRWYLESAPVMAAPAVSAQPRDQWYLESRAAPVARTQPAQVADRWYLESAPAMAAPAVSAQPRDQWYLEPRFRGSAPTQTRHVMDRWYLDP